MTVRRLAIGTVQFGMPYGIANVRGQVTRDEAAGILAKAWAAGVDTLQTAVAYGESEARLGEIGVEHWNVVSKLPAIPQDGRDAAVWAMEQVSGSLARLGLERIDCLMLHRGADLLEERGPALYASLERLKSDGRIGKIGVSIYSPAELESLIPRYPIDLVQAPFNVMDRRLDASGWLDRLHSEGIEVHARSAFLQGLLLMRPEDRPPYFARWTRELGAWDTWLQESGLSPVRASLGFVLSFARISRVVVGVDSLPQLEELLECSDAEVPPPPLGLDVTDETFVNPSLWPAR